MKRTYLMSALLVGFFSACSVYQSADALPDFKERDRYTKEKQEQPSKSKEQKEVRKQLPTPPSQSHQPQNPPKPSKKIEEKEHEKIAKALRAEDAKIENTLKELSVLVAANTKKVEALDKQLTKPQPKQEIPPAKENIQWENVHVEDIPDNKVMITKSDHFLVGYGVSGGDVNFVDEANAKDSAYFNARRMLTSLIYRKFIWNLDRKHLKSEHLKSILLFTIDKAINSADIYKENMYIALPSYNKFVSLFIVDVRVLTRIKRLVQTQYTFTKAQRQVIDQAILDMQNDDATY
ncbi:hypothetical protein [Helicobacter cynogastricus]|uniref:hypothetical protein n=1 Tax=Helicobacter cynogastricus TaxID=329937 RepID=UPI001F28C6C9|nr:hypothetical protein [Helicobacter cynogastricus]